MTHVLKSGATALAAATLVLTAVGAANAETAKIDDRTGDVWRYPSEGSDSYTQVNSPLNVDIDKSTAKHGDRNLVLTTTYKRLAKKDNAYSYWTVETGAGEQYVALTFGGDGDWGGDHTFFQMSSPDAATRQLARGEGECTGMTHKSNFRKDTVTMTIPRTCFGEANRVKSRSLAAAFKNDKTWIDNGHNRGHQETGWTRMLSAG